MQRLSEKLKYWLVSEGLRDLASRTRRTYRRAARSVLPARIEHSEFKGNHAGQRCFIIATGPSLRQVDLSVFKDEFTIGVSFLFLHPKIELFKPRYHVIAPNHLPFDFELVERYLNGLGQNCPWTPTVFYGHIPFQYSIGEYFRQFPAASLKLNIRLIDYSASQSLSEQNHLDSDVWSLDQSPFLPRTVIYSAIQVAHYMGFQKIYLVGCDHNYLMDLNSSAKHFYPEAQGNPKDVQHLAEFTTERWFKEYHLRWRDYRLMTAYLARFDTEILNATEGSMLDVFKKVQLQDVLKSG